jgi:hypothetical protein
VSGLGFFLTLASPGLPPARRLHASGSTAAVRGRAQHCTDTFTAGVPRRPQSVALGIAVGMPHGAGTRAVKKRKLKVEESAEQGCIPGGGGRGQATQDKTAKGDRQQQVSSHDKTSMGAPARAPAWFEKVYRGNKTRSAITMITCI